MKRHLPVPTVALAALSLASCSRLARTPPAAGDVTSQSRAATPTAAPVAASADASASSDSLQQLRDYSKELTNELADTRAALAASETARQHLQETLDATVKQMNEQLAARQQSFAAETVRREKEVESTRGELDQAKAEQAKHAAHAAELEKTAAALEQSAAAKENERKSLEKSIATLQQETRDAAKQQATVLADREQQLKDLGERLAQSDRDKAARGQELEQQRERPAAARRDLDATRAEQQQAATAVKDLDAQVEALKSSATQQDVAKQHLEHQLIELVAAPEAQSKADEAALSERNKQIAELNPRIDETRRESSQHDETLKRRNEEFETARDQLAQAAEQTERLSAERLHELEARAKELDQAKAELQTLQRETEDRKAKADGLQRQIADLRASATARETEQRAKDEKARAQIAELSSHAEKLEQELASFKQAREASAASAERVEREQTNVSAELAGLSRRSDQASLADRAVLTKRLGDLNREGRALDANQRDQQTRIAELEKELADVKKSSQSRLEALENVLKNTRASGADLRSQLDAARERNTSLSQQVGDLKGSVSKVHDLRTTLVEKRRRLEELDSGNAAEDSGDVKTLKLQVAALEADLKTARSAQETSATSVNELIQKTSTPGVEGDATNKTPAGTDNADVRDQLSVERERRQTLEQEVQRLTANGNNEDRYMELWKALQSSRSEILVLSNQLADERRSREEFEVALARLREQSGADAKSNGDFALRLSDTLKERRAEADRLAEELKTANETIVKLKGRLEASGSLAENKALADLDKENETLRRSLAAAEAAREALQAKADVAEHLAEMVYGKFH